MVRRARRVLRRRAARARDRPFPVNSLTPGNYLVITQLPVVTSHLLAFPGN